MSDFTHIQHIYTVIDDKTKAEHKISAFGIPHLHNKIKIMYKPFIRGDYTVIAKDGVKCNSDTPTPEPTPKIIIF